MKYRCIIVDDEPLAIEVIRTHLGNLGLFRVEAECCNAIEAYQALKAGKTDLMFLDIQMPGIKGTDFLKNLVNPPKVIMTTAYRDYAIEGFDLNVVDYLLKPVSYERFLKAVDKFLNNESLKSADNTEDIYIFLNINKNVFKIVLNEIMYAESIKDYLTIHTVTGTIVAKQTITSFENLLPEDQFIRIHRSFIVAAGKIKSFNAHSIDIGQIELPIGPNYKSQVFEKLNYRNLK